MDTRFNQSKFSSKGVNMEEPIDCVKIIIDYCKENYNKCGKCEIDHICEKYFVREPRKWRSK